MIPSQITPATAQPPQPATPFVSRHFRAPPSDDAIVDFSNAVEERHENASVVSANQGKIVSLGGEKYYLKDGGDLALASREVAAAKLYGIYARCPDSMMVRGCSHLMPDPEEKVYIASRLEPYSDFGDWMIAPDSGAKLAAQFPEAFAPSLLTFQENAANAHNLSQSLKAIYSDISNGWWRGADNDPDHALIRDVQPRVAAFDRLMQQQFSLLPQPLQKQIQAHLAASQIVGDWDPINPLYKNMGIVESADGILNIMRVDFGACLDVGFQGEAKACGYDTAVGQRPAIFPELNHPFHRDHSRFSIDLPRIAEEFHDLPYADYAKAIAGDVRWAADTRVSMAYRGALLDANASDADNHVINRVIRSHVRDDESALARGLSSADTLAGLMHGRLSALYGQCGGLTAIFAWERENPDIAHDIRATVSNQLGIDLQPLNRSVSAPIRNIALAALFP